MSMPLKYFKFLKMASNPEIIKYKMDHKERGIALAINIQKFDPTHDPQKKLEERVWSKIGFRVRSLRKAPKLTPAQIKERLEWCLKYRNCDFSNYLFVDETKVDLNRPIKNNLRIPTYHPICIIANYKKRIKLNVWGGISYLGPTKIIVRKK